MSERRPYQCRNDACPDALAALQEEIHEVKYGGFRVRLVREGKLVRLFSVNGEHSTKRYPWIVESGLKNRKTNFVIEGEAVVLGVEGISDFDALASGRGSPALFDSLVPSEKPTSEK